MSSSREELRAQVSDPYLLAACERLLSEIGREARYQDTLAIRLVAASRGVSSNVARCQMNYGSRWESHWQKILPHLNAAYHSAVNSLPSGDAAVKKLNDDMEQMGMNPMLTAFIGK